MAKLVKFGAFVAVFVAAMGALTMLLWNALVPELFRGPVLSFWQAVGLLVLSHLLFRGGLKHGGGWHHRRWKQGMQERLATMTPEEREQFLSRWDQWACCPWSAEPTKREPKA